MKTLIVAILLAGVVPLLLGLLFELVIVAPLRVPLDQTPLFYPWQVSYSHPSPAVDRFLYLEVRCMRVLASCWSGASEHFPQVCFCVAEKTASLDVRIIYTERICLGILSMKSWTLRDDIRGPLHFSDQINTSFSGIIVKLYMEINVAVMYVCTDICILSDLFGKLSAYSYAARGSTHLFFHTRF